MAFVAALFLSSLLTLSVSSPGHALSLNYYDKTCPDAEMIVANTVKTATSRDKTIKLLFDLTEKSQVWMSAFVDIHLNFDVCFGHPNGEHPDVNSGDSLLELVFIFPQGCDASVLLDSKGNNKAEKDGPPNGSLHAFYVIDSAKKQVEAICPGVVSCADILAFAARDAIVLSGGPTWDVPKGRKDGRTSKASETANLPSPLFNISQLQQSFSLRGLSMDDLAALLGAHTLGFAHCSSFESRINTNNVDPTINPTFAQSLRNICPIKNRAKNAGTTMDPSSTTFDNTHYKLILQQKGLFYSDQALLTHPKTKRLVYRFATSRKAFREAFVKSMIKMSSITGGQEVRKDCRVVN
ncbi:hypothetical protein JRO89_XS08G0121400 [Xanthoceras sorbifolium]|uniref:Peroxidase n=1 Tax=Xanthoceras sorbifolium TaxID=99658 RepID=A0ABQ8HPL6_9ROSI|nr:hypothetical protein JRO89_XS08G0121400 [Xanthoceras sorbifolium]